MPRILVVDDDAHIRQALVDRFSARKFDVVSAGSGRDAFAKISRERVARGESAQRRSSAIVVGVA